MHGRPDNDQPWPWLVEDADRPWCIAHRGFSDRAFDNSRQAFDLASAAGADFWEVDVRTTCDGELVAYHDADLRKLGLPGCRIEQLDCADFLRRCADAGQPMMRFGEVVELARAQGAGLYIDAKDRHAIEAAPAYMAGLGVEQGIVASFDAQALSTLGTKGCEYPRSVLVRRGDDPMVCARQADAQLLHLCWEWANTSSDGLLASGLLEQADSEGVGVVLWHEERPAVLRQFLPLMVRGICTNDPELLQACRPIESDRSGPDRS